MTDLTEELIIEINKGIIQEWLEQNPTAFEAINVNHDKLKEILTIVNKQENLIMKAAYLLGGISWSQPFSGGNKRTAFVCADTILRLNGFRFSIESKNEQEYLRKLLLEIQDERSRLNEDVMAKIILYVSKRIRKT